MSEDRIGKAMWFENDKKLKNTVDLQAANVLVKKFEEVKDFMDFTKEERIDFLKAFFQLEDEFATEHCNTTPEGIVDYYFTKADTELFKIKWQIESALARADQKRIEVKEEMQLLKIQLRKQSVRKYRTVFEEYIITKKV